MGRISRSTQLPLYKVKALMKTSKDVASIRPGATFIVAKAAEMFIALLTEEAFKMSHNNDLEYNHIADVVRNEQEFEFLKEFIPQKITVRRYKEILKELDETNKENEAFYL